MLLAALGLVACSWPNSSSRVLSSSVDEYYRTSEVSPAAGPTAHPASYHPAWTNVKETVKSRLELSLPIHAARGSGARSLQLAQQLISRRCQPVPIAGDNRESYPLSCLAVFSCFSDLRTDTEQLRCPFSEMYNQMFDSEMPSFLLFRPAKLW
ncbi:hypothetical protein J6590_093587 [Homalodisca vitripennis]|nr:hypothetical protein J6590_093587 [Homalodisca vitripennis]